MEWEAKKLAEEFLHKISLSEIHLDSTRKNLRQDPSSGIDKMLFDKQLGEWMVYKELENSDSLSSRTIMLNNLDYMLQHGPSDIPDEANSRDLVTERWKDTVKALIKRFRQNTSKTKR